MSSPISSAPAEEPVSKCKTTSPDRAIAFLVHSPNSMLNGLPPDVDNKPLARQRRRRTSPDDQKILEDSFAVNPRPDKAARMEILTKVALGDKEVQIWFQNRRQNSRRKVKNQEPASSPLASSPLTKSRSHTPGPEKQATVERVVEETEKTVSPQETVLQALHILDNESGIPSEVASDEREEIESKEQEVQADIEVKSKDVAVQVESQESERSTFVASSQEQAPSTFPTEPSSSQGIPSSQDAISSYMTKPTYLANRRSASFVRQPAHVTGVNVQSKPVAPSHGRTLSRSASTLRLSMTDDGQARIVDRSIPSPPRSQPAPPAVANESAQGGLRRSYSAAGLNDLFKQSATEQSAPSKVPRVSKIGRSREGRSRDSRAWEFWCDSEARKSLTQTAEQESSGSAADAIGLLRQNSRGALGLSNRKANSPKVGQAGFGSANKQAKPGLQRASTTYGRLQSKRGTEEEYIRSNGDSDKENLDPDEEHVVSRRRTHADATNPSRERTILGVNTKLPSYQSSLGGLMDSEKKRRDGAAVDPEVAAFMDTGTEEVGEDLDCVQSLLSLSKGNWR